jgi:hypothetical protein
MAPVEPSAIKAILLQTGQPTAKYARNPPTDPTFAGLSSVTTESIRTYVAKSIPDNTEVAISTGIDQAVTPIALPNTGFAITAVGIPIKKYVAIATAIAVAHLLAGHSITAVKQVGVITYRKAFRRMMTFRPILFSLKRNRNDCSLVLQRTPCLGAVRSHCM